MKSRSVLVAFSLMLVMVMLPVPAQAALIATEWVFVSSVLALSDVRLRIVEIVHTGDVTAIVPVADISLPTFEVGDTFHTQLAIVTDSPLLLTLEALANGNPAFGFPADTLTPDAPPDEPPIIDTGEVPEGTPPGSGLSASGPIFSFASPGTHVGDYQITVTVVPEPSTLLLLGSGLAGAIGLRRFRATRRCPRSRVAGLPG